MNIALDIDGTISERPEFFAVLSRAVRSAGGKVYVITSRTKTRDVETLTRRELKSYGVEFDALHIIPDAPQDRIPCPHSGLDWYQQYLWQKVVVCLTHNVSIVFEDDPKVIDLFKKHAPEIQVFRVEGSVAES